MAEGFFAPMLDAGIEEVNPSFNRSFIEPCVRAFGHRRVNEYLLGVVESGSNFRKAGAVNALYWAQVPLSFRGTAPSFTIEHATPESRAAGLAGKAAEFAEKWAPQSGLPVPIWSSRSRRRCS